MIIVRAYIKEKDSVEFANVTCPLMKLFYDNLPFLTRSCAKYNKGIPTYTLFSCKLSSGKVDCNMIWVEFM